MKKVIQTLALMIISVGLYAQKGSDGGSSTSEAESGSVEMQNNGFLKTGANPMVITHSDSGQTHVFYSSSILEMRNGGQYMSVGTNPIGQLEFNVNGDGFGSANAIIMDDETGNLGVGISDPTYKLHVAGQAKIKDLYPFLYLETTALPGAGNGGITFHDSNENPQAIINYNHVDDHIRLVNGASTTDGLYIANLNKVGVGTNDPNAKMQINYNGDDDDPQLKLVNNGTNGQARINFGNIENNRVWTQQADTDHTSPASNYFRFEFDDGSTRLENVLFLRGDGNVGIGTGSPNNKLDVAGVVRAEEVIVETGWADYVFEENYELNDLDAVESYILENKHLPNVPSALKIATEGAKVAELMTKMMEKIEELTLYTIQQQKEIDGLKRLNN